jgi:hypothetical protein
MGRLTLAARDCGDIAVTAAEGGIGSWARIDTYRPSRWRRPAEAAEDPVFVFYTITCEDPEKDGVLSFAVTPDFLRQGFRRLLESGRGLDDPSDPAVMDADEADMVVQYAAFGEVVFS